MTFHDWQNVALVAFAFGVMGGLLVAAMIAQIVWKCAASVKVAEAATRIAEAAQVRAEAEVSERRLATAQQRIKDLWTKCGPSGQAVNL